jgi:hypothetical protein
MSRAWQGVEEGGGEIAAEMFEDQESGVDKQRTDGVEELGEEMECAIAHGAARTKASAWIGEE